MDSKNRTPTPKVSFLEKGIVFSLDDDFTGNSFEGEGIYLHHKLCFDNEKNVANEYDFQQKDIQFILKESAAGRGSYNVGENHLIWTDGEPIDPFHIAVVRKDDNGDYESLLERAVKNSGNFSTEFSPQQRAVSGRDPIFKSYLKDDTIVPEWAKNDYWRVMRNETPLDDRLPFLRELVKEQLLNGNDSDDVTLRIPSLAERAKIVASRGYPEDNEFPSRGGNSLFRWRNGYCFYSHFVSDKQIFGDLSFVNSDLQRDNEKEWIIRYALGSCDADAGALVHVFGELYIPVC